MRAEGTEGKGGNAGKSKGKMVNNADKGRGKEVRERNREGKKRRRGEGTKGKGGKEGKSRGKVENKSRETSRKGGRQEEKGEISGKMTTNAEKAGRNI